MSLQNFLSLERDLDRLKSAFENSKSMKVMIHNESDCVVQVSFRLYDRHAYPMAFPGLFSTMLVRALNNNSESVKSWILQEMESKRREVLASAKQEALRIIGME